MHIAIIQFPGSNCERETMLAVKRAGMQPVEFLWNEKKETLIDCDGYIIVGGFSYEDRSRAGIIAALDPVMNIIKQQSELGKPVLGICNGAQILVESGLVPGLKDYQIAMALTDNKRIQQEKILGTGFYNAWVYMRLSAQHRTNAFTRCLSANDILRIPVAHAEGRFVMSPMMLAQIETQGLNTFQYCDAQGQLSNEFPVNPNGSLNNLAAVSNKAGNVMAMMPHPERTTVGDPIFQSMRDYIVERQKGALKVKEVSLREDDVPVVEQIPLYTAPTSTYTLIVESIITDHHAVSVENALQQNHIPFNIKRRFYWEINCDSPEIFEKIKTSGVLYHDRKERVVSAEDVKTSAVKQTNYFSYVVFPREDFLGQQKMQMLKDHFGMAGINSIRHGILWQITADWKTEEKEKLDEQWAFLLYRSHILFNPYSHDIYIY